MKTKRYESLFVIKKTPVNLVIRVLAIILTVVSIPTLSFAVVKLLSEPFSFAESVKSVTVAGITAYLLWPFSYVAIKGKVPSTWHPYQ